jgi:hypothetical protein
MICPEPSQWPDILERPASSSSVRSRHSRGVRVPLVMLGVTSSCSSSNAMSGDHLASHTSAGTSFFSKPVTTSTTLLKPSISSSTVPPIPALAKLMELPTYTGLPVLRASSLERRVVKSSVPPWVYSGVLRVSVGEALCIWWLANVLWITWAQSSV